MPLLVATLAILPRVLYRSGSKDVEQGLYCEESQTPEEIREILVPSAQASIPLQAPTHYEEQTGLENVDEILRPMQYWEISHDGPATSKESLVYVRPDISSFYREPPGSRTAVKSSFNGLAGKFINMSPEHLTLYWDPMDGSSSTHIATVGPFETTGTASFPGHVFYFARQDDPDHNIVIRFNVIARKSLYAYNPFLSEPGYRTLDSLSDKERELYTMHRMNLAYALKYKEFTGGSEWLTSLNTGKDNMHPRSRPRHSFWKADYFGQEHNVVTRETHFITTPPQEKLGMITAFGSERILSPFEVRTQTVLRAWIFFRYIFPQISLIRLSTFTASSIARISQPRTHP